MFNKNYIFIFFLHLLLITFFILALTLFCFILKDEKKSIWSNKNRGVSERAKKDEIQDKAENVDALEKSR